MAMLPQEALPSWLSKSDSLWADESDPRTRRAHSPAWLINNTCRSHVRSGAACSLMMSIIPNEGYRGGTQLDIRERRVLPRRCRPPSLARARRPRRPDRESRALSHRNLLAHLLICLPQEERVDACPGDKAIVLSHTSTIVIASTFALHATYAPSIAQVLPPFQAPPCAYIYTCT